MGRVFPEGYGLALALTLALAACGEPLATPAPTPKETAAIVEDAADPCGPAQPEAPPGLCADPAIAPLNARLREALGAAAGQVSPKGAQILVANHKQWLDAQRLACGVPSAAKTLSADASSCLRRAFEERLGKAPLAVQKLGGFVVQRVEITASGAAEARSGAVDAASRTIAYPRIDGDTPAIARFNAAVAQAPRFKPEDRTEESVAYSIAYAGPDLVSVKFDLFDFTAGAARPNQSVKAVTVLMRTGLKLAPEDVFRPGSGWEDALAAKAAPALAAALAEEGEETPVPEADLRTAATDPAHWLVREQGLTLLFPPGSVVSPLLGPRDVTIPWPALREYLRPEAPAPIGSG